MAGKGHKHWVALYPLFFFVALGIGFAGYFSTRTFFQHRNLLNSDKPPEKLLSREALERLSRPSIVDGNETRK